MTEVIVVCAEKTWNTRKVKNYCGFLSEDFKCFNRKSFLRQRIRFLYRSEVDRLYMALHWLASDRMEDTLLPLPVN